MINIIVAADRNGCIGRENKLCWNIKGDLENFKKLTTGNFLLMGRKTFESLPGNGVLPNRTSIVITRNKDYKVPEGVYIANTIEDGIEIYKTLKKDEELFIIGGAQIYAQSAQYADTMYYTHVCLDVKDGDAFVNKPSLVKHFNRGPMIQANVDPIEQCTYFFEKYTKHGEEDTI